MTNEVEVYMILLHILTLFAIRMMTTTNTPSLPSGILTDFGRNLHQFLAEIFHPIQSEIAISDEVRDTIFREVRESSPSIYFKFVCV